MASLILAIRHSMSDCFAGTKTRGTDFWLLLPQLEGGQCGVKRVVRTTRDTFPARTMYPQGCHPRWRIIDTIEQGDEEHGGLPTAERRSGHSLEMDSQPPPRRRVVAQSRACQSRPNEIPKGVGPGGRGAREAPEGVGP
ncbi:hypothetical protein JZ751_004406, partial [Albula glossodonta]